jgi:hypothetical protein
LTLSLEDNGADVLDRIAATQFIRWTSYCPRMDAGHQRSPSSGTTAQFKKVYHVILRPTSTHTLEPIPYFLMCAATY